MMRTLVRSGLRPQASGLRLKNTSSFGLVVFWLALAACHPSTTQTQTDFAFDGTCVKCHLGLSAGHTHPGYKLRCIDCHGGNDQVDVPDDATTIPAGGSATDPGKFRDPMLIAQAHVLPKAGLARFFFANGVDDDNDGKVDETIDPTKLVAGTQLADLGEVYQPGLHGEGPGEFVDSELQRDLNYTRFLNPGDLRVATVGCGARSRAALDGGAGGGCHQETVDVVRRSIMVNQPAVINGAYYGNESWRAAFQMQRAMSNSGMVDPRAGAFAYGLDYDGVDGCIDLSATNDGPGGRGQPRFDSTCLEQRAASLDPTVAAGAPGNAGLPAFEMAQGPIAPPGDTMLPGNRASDPGTTIPETGAEAGQDRYPWGGTAISDPSAERASLAPVPSDVIAGTTIPDPVDIVLRTFRAYYPLNYPGSTTNQDFTFGTSILPDQQRFVTADPFGRGHSSGCSACHVSYNYDGSRNPTPVVQDDGSVKLVVDPTTKHREFDPATQDEGMENGADRLIGRAVTAQQQADSGRAQQRTYGADHVMTTAITTDQCGLCHGFVTRINYAYQGMAEEEQRDQLARRAPIQFMTPSGTKVRILDSWVREDHITGQPVVEHGDAAGEAMSVIAAAEQRDAMLAAQGFVPGNGGCAPGVFTEDCNNDGELEHSLALTHTDPDGTTRTLTIDEDANGNGALDLIDRVPREKSIDGRQVRYIYGGRNGSTRLMDIHFQKGMACIDCHFLQDAHGDGHVYSTNWDQIEVECEDCHGAKAQAKLVTSGPDGGNDLTKAHDANGVPYFQVVGGKVIQRSRVTPGVSWVIPQTVDDQTPLAKEAHGDMHVADPGAGSTFAGKPGQSALVDAKLECATCHSSWVLNCMGCHIDLNQGDAQRLTVDASGNLSKTAAENEIWLSNAPDQAHVNFQLIGLLRAPFVLGVSGSSEQGRLATFRSSMEAQVTVTDANGNTAIDNATFTTFQPIDGNSGRANVATSAVAMNQTMPHTVRPAGEERGCESCHPLVDAQGRVRNEHVLAETYGLGTGAAPYIGDWAIAAGTNGLELYDYKQERELKANKPGASTRFPGMIVSPCDRTPAKVEPVFDGSKGIAAGAVASDVVLVRNFAPTPAPGAEPAEPTLTDLAVTAVASGTSGAIVVADVTARGNPASARPSVGDQAHEFVLPLPAVPRALAHISPDVSDPFVYAAVGVKGVSAIELLDRPRTGGTAAKLDATVALATNHTATALALAGDILYVGTAEGTVEPVSLADPANPAPAGTPIQVGGAVNALALDGFVLYAATPSGVAALALDDPMNPMPLPGATGAMIVPGIAAKALDVGGGHLYVAAGTGGVIDIDVRTPAAPMELGDLTATLAPGQTIDAADVELSVIPGQDWLLVLDAGGDLWGLKLDKREAEAEKCYPDPKAAGCTLSLAFLDPTQSGRDPSFDPTTSTFDPGACTQAGDPHFDPSAPSFFHLTHAIVSAGHRLARGALWEQIGTLTGRRVRDSFMPGSGVLSLPVMQTMRSVQLCESSAPSNEPGDLGAIGYADQAFLAGGQCQPIGQSTRTVRSLAVRRPKRP